MVYNQVYQGWIYTITNKVNGKQYVGQTIDFKRRQKQHFCETESCPLLRKAFEKYGREQFEMLPILTFSAINEEVRRVILNELEQYYIKRLNTYNNGYNTTKGGTGQQGHSPSEEIKTKIKERNVEWWSKEENKKKHQKSLPTKPILQYDREGNFIKEYESVTEAAQQFKSSWSALQTISDGARKEKGLILGYQWRYKNEDTYPKHIEKYLHKDSIPVYHYTQDGKLIEKYDDTGEASRATGLDRKYIKSAISWDSRHPDSKKLRDYWSRREPK